MTSADYTTGLPVRLLNLCDAVGLYKILQPYLSDIDYNGSVFDVIHSIIGKMKNNPSHYGICLQIITGLEPKFLFDNATTEEMLAAFADGLIQNQILLLKQTLEKLGL